MFAKRFLQKATQHHRQHQHQNQQHQSQSQSPQGTVLRERETFMDVDPRVTLHYGIPSTASMLALDPIQSLLAVGTLDGRIKIFGGNHIEVLLMSEKQLPFKHLEFLQNQGFLVSISNDNDIQVWDLEYRHIACTLQWESNITSFSVIRGTAYMYIGDENGMVFVLKYESKEKKLIQLPYLIPADSVAEAATISIPPHCLIVGILPQPSSYGNRLLIAYEHGLIVLWDVSTNHVVSHRGYKDLQLKSKAVVVMPKEAKHELSADASDDESMEKEISSLCWASTNGSVLAVGYVDGDVLLWDFSSSNSTTNAPAGKSSKDVVKLNLSSGDRRLPVILLRWSAGRVHDGPGGQLFIYGGDDVGSEEVLTILSIDWSRGLENIKCINRVDLTLNGSFTDMALLSTSGSLGATSLIVLTNPGQLQVYDDALLSTLISQQERPTPLTPLPYSMVLPTVEPQMTVSKLGVLDQDGKFSKHFSEIVAAASHTLDVRRKGPAGWPFTGGIPSQLLHAEDRQVERLYLAGYQDGSVQILDATYPVLSLIYELEAEVKGTNLEGLDASVSAIDFCSCTLSLAVGYENGHVRVYLLISNSEEIAFHVVMETKTEVHNLHQEAGPQCVALFSLLHSRVCTLKFVSSGSRIAVGFQCGQVAILDTTTLSVLSLRECVSGSDSPIIFLDTCPALENYISSESESKGLETPRKCPVYVLTKNAHIAIVDACNGNSIGSCSLQAEKDSAAVSIHLIKMANPVSEVPIEDVVPSPRDNAEAREGSDESHGSANKVSELNTYMETASTIQELKNICMLLCYEDALTFYLLDSALQLDNNLVQRVRLVKPCCWTAILHDDGRDGIVLVYQTGDMEIRSLPNLEVIWESSLKSILRWNFRTNMEKMMSSSGNGQISMVTACELAFVSLLAHENELRIPQSLPCLHQKDITAAMDSGGSVSPHKKTEGAAHGILGGIRKGKVVQGNVLEFSSANPVHLEATFSRPLMLESTAISHDKEVIELDIDDIEIDEPVTVSSSSQTKSNKIGSEDKKPKGERERLFEGASTDFKPRMRTREEIIAKYRKNAGATAAASQARDKLMERQEKLEKLSRRTEELQSGAEDFASLASELAKRMENRSKWWNIF